MPEKTTQKEHGKKTAPPSEKEVQPEVVIQMCGLQKYFSKTFKNFATNADKIVLIG